MKKRLEAWIRRGFKFELFNCENPFRFRINVINPDDELVCESASENLNWAMWWALKRLDEGDFEYSAEWAKENGFVFVGQGEKRAQ